MAKKGQDIKGAKKILEPLAEENEFELKDRDEVPFTAKDRANLKKMREQLRGE